MVKQIKNGNVYKKPLLDNITKIMSDLYTKKYYMSLEDIAKEVNVSYVTVQRYLAVIQKDRDVDLKVRLFIKRTYPKNRFYDN